MNRYPIDEQSFLSLLQKSLRLHYLTLKHTIAFIICITVVKYFAVWIEDLSSSLIFEYVIDFIAACGIAYFFAAALLATHRAFVDQPDTTKNIINKINMRVKPILMTFIIYILGGVIVVLFGKSLGLAIEKFFPNSTNAAGFILLVRIILLMAYIALFYFSFPLSVIDEKPAAQAFYASVVLTEKQKWGVFVSFFIFAITILLLTPATISEYFFSVYHVDIVFDFIVLCIAVPLYINLLLFLINNAKKQVVMN